MLGLKIQELRRHNAVSREELARKSGLEIERIDAIETGRVAPPLDKIELMALADALDIRNAFDYVRLMKLNKPPRFKAYNTGIGKTGTLSLAHIFRAYRSLHQFMMSETLEAIRRRDRGEMAPTDFRAFILDRDRRGGLEMDSSAHHCFYLDILAEEFPEAKFIFVIRDSYSWLDSVLNMLSLPGSGFTSPGRFDFDSLNPLCKNVKELAAAAPQWIDGPLAFWALCNKMALERLPEGRTLILRTNEISRRVEAMADFLGVAPETLDSQNSHTHQARAKIDALRSIDRNLLEERFERHCGELMERFFPGYTLEKFLNGQPIAPHPDY